MGSMTGESQRQPEIVDTIIEVKDNGSPITKELLVCKKMGLKRLNR